MWAHREIPIPPIVIERIRAGWHYVCTGIGIHGDELIAVSEQYLCACFPSRQEYILRIAGGVLSGFGWVYVLAWATLWPRLVYGWIGWICSLTGACCLIRQRRLRNARQLFRKSEEARRLND